MGKRTAPWKAALWGAVAGTLPDLDVLYDFGDSVSNMVFHRGITHGLVPLSLFAPILAVVPTVLHREKELYKFWIFAMFFSLVTHPLLDWFTIYGTQLGNPFDNTPLGLGSIFIIDLLFTLPLLVVVILAIRNRSHKWRAWVVGGLCLSCAYLGWSAIAQYQVKKIAAAQLAEEGRSAEKYFVSATAFNTIVWRIVVRGKNYYDEGFYSLFDRHQTIRFTRFSSEDPLAIHASQIPALKQIMNFSNGFYRLKVTDQKMIVTDLRMGQEPFYVFNFGIAEKANAELGRTQDQPSFDQWKVIQPEPLSQRPDLQRAIPWLLRRMQGVDELPPR